MPRLLRSLPLVAALGSTAAFAVYPNTPSDSEFTSVGYLNGGGASGVAIDSRWVLTASHVDGTKFTLPGVSGDFNVLQSISAPLINGVQPDLRLLQVDRDLPSFTRVDDRSAVNRIVAIVGVGDTGSYDAAGIAPSAGGNVRRRANNLAEFQEDVFYDAAMTTRFNTLLYRIDRPSSPNYVVGEGGLLSGDSGGGFFADFGDGFRLVGTNSFIASATATSTAYEYGAFGGASALSDPAALSFIRTYVPQAVVPEPATLAALGVGALGLLRRRRLK